MRTTEEAWTSQVEKESKSVDLKKEDAKNRARWRVGVREIAGRVGYIRPPSFTGIKPDQNWIDDDDDGAISSVMFSFLISSSTTLLQVFFGVPAGLPSTSSSIALLSMIFSPTFYIPSHLNLAFLNLSSRFSTPNLLLTFSLVILSCHLTRHVSQHSMNTAVGQQSKPITNPSPT